MSSTVEEEDTSEKGFLEKAVKDHQMMRNAKKSKKSKNTKSRNYGH